MIKRTLPLLVAAFIVISCGTGRSIKTAAEQKRLADSLARVDSIEKALAAMPLTADEISLEKELLYDQHTLEDEYPYGKTTRRFQWDKARAYLVIIENIQMQPASWGVLQNHRNKNREADLVGRWSRNAYKRVADTLGVERWQGTPLYAAADTVTPVIYGRDGALVKIIRQDERWTLLQTIYEQGRGEWLTPSRYVWQLADTVSFRKVILVDRANQNITALEKKSGAFDKKNTAWLIRSMNPATTGLHHPPYAQETPLGIFVIQEKKKKMLYTHDGSSELAGYAPWASRFSNGGYVHGVPLNSVNAPVIEFSWTLGTTPRSHMCVRNASSHAEFVFGWAPTGNALVVVIE